MRRSFATASTSLRYANGHNEIQEVLACARTENAGLHGRRGLEEHLVGRDGHKAIEHILVIQGDLNAFARHFAADNFLGRAHVLRGRVDNRVARFGVDVDFHGRRKRTHQAHASLQ